MKSNVLLNRLLTTPPLLWVAQAARAHEGHGLPGSGHWHATDAWGFIVMAAAAAAAAALWWRGRK